MSDHYWLTEPQPQCIKTYFPQHHGKPRVDDSRVISGIILVIRNGLRWRDAPVFYGLHKTLYNHFVRWSRKGVFDRIFSGLEGSGEEPDIVMIDAIQLKAHRTACSLAKKGDVPRRIGRTKGSLNSKLHALSDGIGRPLVLCLSEGQLSDHIGAKLIYPAMPNAKVLIGDKGNDSDEFREALNARKIKSDNTNELHQKLLHAPSQGGKHVRKAQRLEAHRNQIRPLCTYIHVSNLHRCNHHLLDQSMNPDPRSGQGQASMASQTPLKTHP